MSVSDLAPGKWILEKSENFDEYMKAIGVGMATRLIANKLKPSTEISVNDGTWTIKTLSTFKNSELSFKLAEEFDETTPDGRKCKTTVTADANKMIFQQNCDVPTSLVREFTADKMNMTMTAKDVTCTRVYKRE